jgi:hypothetical protein
MSKAIIPALSFVLLSAVLGATVFREQVAHAASAVLQVREQNLDPQGNIKVHEQGTANVNVTNATVSVHEQGLTATRSANDEVAVTKTIDEESAIECPKDIYTVPQGKQLVIQYVSSANAGPGLGPSGSGPSAEIVSGSVLSPLEIDLPFVFASQGSGVSTASEAVHYVVPGGTTLIFVADVTTPPCSFVVSLGGYLQPNS